MNIFDPHISGSLSVSGSGEISGDLTVLGTLFATISGTSQNAISASHAEKYLLTSSFQTFTGSYTTGAFTGSFIGDGSGLYNIPASGVTGLNLTRIADGSATASISNVDGLRINTNTEITGTLKVNNVSLVSDSLVLVSVTDAGGKYFIDNVRNPTLKFIRGFTYKFLYTNIGSHPFRFSTTNDGTHNGGTIYSTGVTTGETPNYIQIEVTNSTPSTLYYFCTAHTGMGNSISVSSDVLNSLVDNTLVYIDPSRIATTGSNDFIGTENISGSLNVTGSENISGSLNVTGSVNITGSITLNGQAIGTGKLDEITFQAYTSSNDGRLFAIENSTSSYNTFTSSIDTRIKNEMNEENVISGSIQVLITGTTGYSTFSSSVSASIGSLSSSLDGTISTLSSSIATTTSGLTLSIGSLSSSVASTTSGLTLSISSLSSSAATTTSDLSSSIGSLSSSVATTTSGLSSSIGSLSSSVATTTSGLSSSIWSISSSFSSLNDTQNSRLTNIEASTGSLNTFTSSIDTTIKNKLNSESVISGSVQVILTGTTGYSTFSSSISTSIGTLSSSIDTTINGLSSSIATTTNGLSSSIATTTSGLTLSVSSLSSSVATTTNELSSSIAVTTSGLTLSISSLSSSVATTTSGLSSSIGSLSSSIATTDLNQNNRLDSIEGKTGSYATTGSNIFQGSQTITGSLYVSQDLIVAGSSSIQHISSSIVNIADNIITVNAQNPSIRFGGLGVIDSGSSPQVSGSMLFDSTNDQWVFVHQNQGTITSSVLLMGPETYNNLGGETYLTLNRIPKGSGIEHLRDSNITDTGTKVSINSNTEVTGTFISTGNISSPNVTAIETSTGSLNTFTSSLLTAIELTGSNLTVRGNLLVKGTTTNVNTTTLDVDNNLINLNGTGATLAGLRVKDTTAPNQVSGSLLWDATNDYWIAGQLGSEQRIVRETEFNTQVTRINNVETSTGSLNSFTSSINTTIKNKLNSDGVISGSSQVLSGTGIWSGSAQLPSGVVSGSSQVLAGTTIHSGAFFNGISVVSGSAQISFNGITDKPTLVSGSSQITFLSISSIPSGLVSGSSQVLSGTGIWSGSAQLPSGVVSGSAQVVSLLPSGTVSGSSQITGIGNSQLTNSSFFVGTTSISLGRASSAQTLSGVSIDGTVTKTITSGAAENFLYANVGSDDYVRVRGGSDGYNTGWIEIATSDDGTEPIYVRQYNGVFSTIARTATLLDGSGNTSFPGTINGLTISSGTISSGTWNGTAIGDSYISSASNWNTAYNKRISTLGFTSSTVTITLADSTTVTASVPTFNQNTTGTAANITASSNTSLTSLANLATVGTITSGTWNGSAIGNAYLANSSFNIGTTSISLGRASASQTLTGVSIDGNAATVSNLTAVQFFNNMGDGHTTRTSFDASTPSYGFGFRFVQGSTNGPGTGASQYYSWYIGLGNDYPATGAGSYGAMFAVDRNSSTPYFSVRYNENNSFSSWRKIYAGYADSAGNASTVTNGVYTNGSYSDPSWITSLAGSKISGTVASATTADQIDSIGFRNTNTSGVAANTLDSNGLTYVTDVDGSSTNLTGNSTDGALYSQIYSSSWQHQIYGDYRTGIMYVRGKNNGTWAGWKRVALSSATTFSSVTSLTFTHNLGTANVTAQVFDTNGDMFFPSNIRISSTQVIVTFASSRSGRLVVTG